MLKFEKIIFTGFIIGGLSLLVFFMAHAGLLSPGYMALPLFLAVFFLYLVFKGSIKDIRPKEPLTKVEWLLFALIVIFIFLVLPLSLCPPSVRDELINHLAIPALYIKTGQAHPISFMPYSYLPMNIDLLYLVGLVFGSDVLPRLTHFLFALLTGCIIYSYLHLKLSRAYALLGFLLFISTPVVMNLSRMAYVDLGVGFFVTISLFSMLQWRDGKEEKWLLYSAVAMGLALGSKYNAAIAFFLMCMFIGFLSLQRKNNQAVAVKDGVVFFVLAMFVFSPWLIRNQLWAGNPFYPMLQTLSAAVKETGTIHAGESLTPIKKRELLYNETILDMVLVPLRIFYDSKDNSIQKFDGVLNPFFLFFFLCAFLKRHLKDLQVLVLFVLLYFFMTFFTADLVIRYLLPVFPAFIIILVAGVKNVLEHRWLKYAGVVFALLLVLFNFNYIGGLHSKYKPFNYLTGAETRDAYLGRVLADYEVTMYANENIPKDARILFLFAGDRGYYWERDYLFAGRTGENLLAYVRGASTPAILRDAFVKDGFTHIFLNNFYIDKFAHDNFNEDELALVVAFFNSHMVRLHTAKGFSIYELR